MKLKLSPDALALNPQVGRTVAIAADAREAQKARVPRADAQERDGLGAMITAGWNVQTPDCTRYRLYRGALDTGLCESASAAVVAAKELEK